jgi:hypothetical protein
MNGRGRDAYDLMTAGPRARACATTCWRSRPRSSPTPSAEGADADLWAATALLHDFDYERHPDLGPGGHPYVGVEHLRALGAPEVMLDAILGHADHTGTCPAPPGWRGCSTPATR